MSAIQDAVLATIRVQYAETGEPVTEQQVRRATPMEQRRFIVSAVAALIRKGLLTVPRPGSAAWVPTKETT